MAEHDPFQEAMGVLDDQKAFMKEGAYLEMANALGRLRKQTRPAPRPRVTRDNSWLQICFAAGLRPEQERCLRLWLEPAYHRAPPGAPRHPDDHRCVAVDGKGARCARHSDGCAPFLCYRHRQGKAGKDRARMVMHTMMMRSGPLMELPLPEGWEAVRSRSVYGEVYYVNRARGVSTWVPPYNPLLSG